jgi:hypothetical protein
MESTASDDIIGCMFALLDDVAMAGGGGGGGGGCGGGVDSSVVTVLKMKDLHLGPRASGKRYSGILGHTGHTYSGIIFGFGFWGFGIWGDLGELIFGGRPDYSWHRFGGSS